MDSPVTDNSGEFQSTHGDIIRALCRLCAVNIRDKHPKRKDLLARELNKLFNIDTANENPNIYPNHLCNNHASSLYKYRKDEDKIPSSISLFPFESLTSCSSGQRCELCQRHSRHNVKVGTRVQNPMVLIETQFDKLNEDMQVQSINNLIAKISDTQLDQVLKYVGSKQRDSIKEDSQSLNLKYKSITYLKAIDYEKYFLARNPVLVSLLCEIAHIDKKSITDKKLALSLACIIESMYKLAVPSFIGPVSFINNLTILQISGSKIATNIAGSQGAGGKYNVIKSWFENTGASQETPCPEGDVLFMFDNEQCIGKTWTVKPNNKVKMSVVTNIAVAQLNKHMAVQHEELLSPRYWLKVEGNEQRVEEMTSENTPRTDALKTEHYNQLYHFLEAAIHQVEDEQVKCLEEYSDTIDIAVKDERTRHLFKECPTCRSLYDKKKLKCDTCKEKLTCPQDTTSQTETYRSKVNLAEMDSGSKTRGHTSNLSQSDHKYSHIESNHKKAGIQITLLDPVFVNPNSFESVALVLRHIGLKAGIKRYGGDKREWLTLCCDGLPYGIVIKLIENSLVCGICDAKIYGYAAFREHCMKVHHNSVDSDVQYYKEFDWILLKVGDGHYEMNLIKSFVELNWVPFMEDLVKRMGWRSETALASAKKCYDNHKAWQILLVFHFGTMLELVLPYVRQCLQNESRPTVQGFISFGKAITSPNYMYMFEMVTKYTQGIINFRMGIRRNNSNLVQSAKHLTKEIFHGRVHPKYQEIEIYDCFQRHVMPRSLTSFAEEHESMSKSGGKDGNSKGQGYDFILEEENRDVKRWIRKGVPTNTMWQNICRNSEALKEIKANLLSAIGTDDTSGKEIDMNDAIKEWRVGVRKVQYLQDMAGQDTHTSLSGVPLHHSLRNFTSIAQQKRGYRVLDMLLHADHPEFIGLSNPVHVTHQEHEETTALENRTIAEIANMCLDLIAIIPDAELQNHLTEKFKKEVHQKKKATHINFFREVTESINHSFSGTENGIVFDDND